MVAYESLKTKEKSILVIPELVAVAFGSFSLQSLSFEFKQGFTKVVVTIAGRLREWSQGELRLNLSNSFPVTTATTGSNMLSQNYSI